MFGDQASPEKNGPAQCTEILYPTRQFLVANRKTRDERQATEDYALEGTDPHTFASQRIRKKRLVIANNLRQHKPVFLSQCDVASVI